MDRVADVRQPGVTGKGGMRAQPSAPTPPIAFLQSAAGNRAVAGLLQRSPVPAGRPAVQRTATLRPGSRYATMPADLLAFLGRTLDARTFWAWGSVPAGDLDAALDILQPPEIDALRQVYSRLSALGWWGNLTTMKTVWATTSLGFDYNATSSLSGLADASTAFCIDTALGGIMHRPNTCWREIVPAGTPGLHICGTDSVHVDTHQISSGSIPGISIGPGGLGIEDRVCWYLNASTTEHWRDVLTSNPPPLTVYLRWRQGKQDSSRYRSWAQYLETEHHWDAQATRWHLDEADRLFSQAEDPLRTAATNGTEASSAQIAAATPLLVQAESEVRMARSIEGHSPHPPD